MTIISPAEAIAAACVEAASQVPKELPSILQAAPRLEAEMTVPAVLLYYGPKKQGKTRILADLPDCRIVDLERGTKYLEKLPYEPFRPRTVEELEEFCKECAIHKPYKYVAFDPLDQLEEWAIQRSTAFHAGSPVGQGQIKAKSWDGKSILTVPGNATGGSPTWGYLRAEMQHLLNLTMTAAERVIWVAHVRESLGEDVKTREGSSADVDLIGKARATATGKSDAFALCIRGDADPSKLFLTFRYKGNQVRGGGGGRCAHLQGREIVIAEMSPQGVLTTHWDLVYPDLKP